MARTTRSHHLNPSNVARDLWGAPGLPVEEFRAAEERALCALSAAARTGTYVPGGGYGQLLDALDPETRALVVAATHAEWLRLELNSTRAVSESRRCDIEHLRAEVADLRARLAAHEGTDPTVASVYPNTAWTGSGPYHLVTVTMEPYPGVSEVPLPPIWVPGQRSLCGKAKWSGTVGLWPKASEVCPRCVERVPAPI